MEASFTKENSDTKWQAESLRIEKKRQRQGRESRNYNEINQHSDQETRWNTER